MTVFTNDNFISKAQFQSAIQALGFDQKTFAAELGMTEQSISGWNKKADNAEKNAYPSYVIAYINKCYDARNVLASKDNEIQRLEQRLKDATPLTLADYLGGVEQLATDIISDAIERALDDNGELFDDVDDMKEAAESIINDWMLHERIDGDSWIIYYRFNPLVIAYSDNESYMADNIGMEGAPSDFSTLQQQVAFWALYGDVMDKINEEIEDKAKQATHEEANNSLYRIREAFNEEGNKQTTVFLKGQNCLSNDMDREELAEALHKLAYSDEISDFLQLSSADEVYFSDMATNMEEGFEPSELWSSMESLND